MLPLLYARENVVISDRSFDAETTAIIGKAFDKACEEMHDKTQPGWFRERVAKRLIEIAARGERDPETMCESALISLGLVPNRFATLPPNFARSAPLCRYGYRWPSFNPMIKRDLAKKRPAVGRHAIEDLVPW